MKTVAQLLTAFLMAAVALVASGCNYTKPVMYINLSNNSGHSIRNIEMTYPTGTFGLPELRNDHTHRRMTPIGSPCKFGIKFEDEAGRKQSSEYDLGAKCPMEITFDVGEGMKVSERLVRP